MALCLIITIIFNYTYFLLLLLRISGEARISHKLFVNCKTMTFSDSLHQIYSKSLKVEELCPHITIITILLTHIIPIIIPTILIIPIPTPRTPLEEAHQMNVSQQLILKLFNQCNVDIVVLSICNVVNLIRIKRPESKPGIVF